MNIINKITRNLGRLAALAVLGVAFCASQCQAVNIEMWVLAKGKTWAMIIPGSNTGGYVIYNAQHGCYITDRAQRGETVKANLTASTAPEKGPAALKRCWLSSTGGTRELSLYWNDGWLPDQIKSFTMPTSVFWDNNYINVKTVSGAFSLRIPCGGRP